MIYGQQPYLITTKEKGRMLFEKKLYEGNDDASELARLRREVEALEEKVRSLQLSHQSDWELRGRMMRASHKVDMLLEHLGLEVVERAEHLAKKAGVSS